jgi:hypothetical protein
VKSRINVSFVGCSSGAGSARGGVPADLLVVDDGLLLAEDELVFAEDGLAVLGDELVEEPHAHRPIDSTQASPAITRRYLAIT